MATGRDVVGLKTMIRSLNTGEVVIKQWRKETNLEDDQSA
jgi:hypothetical protein